MDFETPQEALQKQIKKKTVVYTAWVDNKVKVWINKVSRERFRRTIKRAKKVIAEMIEKGWSRKKMRRELAKKFRKYSQYELDRVLTTEAVRAINLGTYVEEEKDDMVIGWKVVVNYKGCPVCDEAQGKGFIPRKKMREELMPPLHPNCECTLEPVFEGEE